MAKSASGLAPIVLFVYARPDHTRQTLEALARNRLADQSSLYIYSDAPRNERAQEPVNEVRRLIRERQWCGRVEIIEAQENRGLANSIRGGVTEVVNAHGRVIVMEDDLVTSPGFLAYMNAALDVYADVPAVRHIAGYFPATPYAKWLPSTFFIRYMQCWGWATWQDSWARAEWDIDALIARIHANDATRSAFNLGDCNGYSDQLLRNQSGELKTWAIYWAASIFLQGGLCLNPRYSLVKNIGVDGTGENFTQDFSDSIRVNLAEQIPVKRHRVKRSIMGEFSLQQALRWGSQTGFNQQCRCNLGMMKHRLWKKLKWA